MSKSNFRIQNNINDISEGVDYEFVLKDSNVLEEANDDLIELENSLLRDITKRKNKNDFSSINEKNEILAQYNKQIEESFLIERNDNELRKSPETTDMTNRDEINKIKEKFKLMKDKNLNIDQGKNKTKNTNSEVKLDFEKKFTTDYMTNEEYNKGFKKIKSGGTHKKRIHSDEGDEILKNISNEKIMNKAQVYDEYDELNLFLDQQRNLINKEKNNNIRPLPIVNVNVSNINKIINPDEHVEFISDTTEFLKKVPSKKEVDEDLHMIISHNNISLRDIKSGTQSVVNVPLPSERLKYGVSSVISQETQLINHKRERLEDNLEAVSNNRDDTQVQLEEPLVGKGIAVALTVLRKRGLIGKKELWGRYKDKHYTSNEMFLKDEERSTSNKAPGYKQYDHEIQLENRDNKGRLLTPKEMYRYQSYIFHGIGPGKKKIEKRMLREQLQEKLKNKDPAMLSKSFIYLKNIQKKNNTPYLVLQGKNPSLT